MEGFTVTFNRQLPSARPSRCVLESRQTRGLRVQAVLSRDPTSSGSQQPLRKSSIPKRSGSGTSPKIADPKLASKLNNLFNVVAEQPIEEGATVLSRTKVVTEEEVAYVDMNVGMGGAPSVPGPVAGPHSCWYFAYGSNIHRDTLFSQDVNVLSRDAAVVCDPDVRLVFRHKGGLATLLKLPGGASPMFSSPDANVHGVLYQLENTELAKLNNRPGEYDLIELNVQTYSGRAVRAFVFVSSYMAMLSHEVLPTEAYMRKLREGAADQLLDPAYQAWLSSIETVSSAGLPLEYWNTPAKYIGYAFLLMAAFITAGFFTM